MAKDLNPPKKGNHHPKPDNYTAPHVGQRKEGSSKTDERETQKQKVNKDVC